MKHVLLLFSGFLVMPFVYGQTQSVTNTINIAALVMALLAMVIAVWALNRVSFLKRKLDAEIHNQKDDLTLTMERFKQSLNHRNQPRQQHNQGSAKPQQQQQRPQQTNRPSEGNRRQPQQPRTENQKSTEGQTQSENAGAEGQRNPNANRNRYKRRPPRRNPENSSQSNSAPEQEQ